MKDFEECCHRSKRSKIRKLQDNVPQALIDAAASSSPSTSSFDPDAALALTVQAKLTKEQYEVIRKASKEIGHDIYPSYKKVTEAKKKCYPNNSTANETSAFVPLQDLLDHTCNRILKTLDEKSTVNRHRHLVLQTKWGCDGASGQSRYMQNYEVSEEGVSDEHIFLTSLVPLKLVEEEKEDILWKNPRPSSTRYCRAIRFSFSNETPEEVRKERDRVENEIKNLRATEIEHNGFRTKITHVLYFTMIDGKTVQIVTNTSASSNCTICGARPSEMNNISSLQLKPTNNDSLKFGMSTLHARIRFMEYILHLSYNLPFKAWRITPQTAELKKNTKTRIQNEFRQKLGLLVDVVKRGCGTTNSGNTSRRFFDNPSLTSEITKIDENLIRRLATILEVICCNHYIDAGKFQEYSIETANIAVKLYPWYYLPASVHKILLHGKEIIESCELPIGTLSEEAQESRNKDYRYFRSNNSRKISRTATNEDVLHMFLISSDPYISFLRPEPKSKNYLMSEEAKHLLI